MIFLLIALLSVAQAAELNISRADYDSAQKAESYFKFTGHSRKLGIIGTSFEGFAKKAIVSFDRKGKSLKNVSLEIPVASLDTDNDSRNEKMLNTCLSAVEFPLLKVTVTEPIDQEKSTQKLAAVMLVRGKSVPLDLQVEKVAEGKFKGSSVFKLSEAGIPDPSIAIASVKDEFELEFQVEISEAK